MAGSDIDQAKALISRLRTGFRRRGGGVLDTVKSTCASNILVAPSRMGVTRFPVRRVILARGGGG